jgi:hypothetical protein
VREQAEQLIPPTPVPTVFTTASYDGPESSRNIFVYYVPPPKPVKPPPTPIPPPPPTTPATAIVIDNNPMPTRFINAQQLATLVPASMIANDGARQVVVRTPDNKEFSNPLPLIVAAPPPPNFIYIGIIGKVRYNDTAVLKDKSNPECAAGRRRWRTISHHQHLRARDRID